MILPQLYYFNNIFKNRHMTLLHLIVNKRVGVFESIDITIRMRMVIVQHGL